MSKATLTVDGYTAAPRLHQTKDGTPVATIAVGHTPRKKDGRGGWEDAGPTLWVEGSFWGEQADEAAKVAKGTHVILSGTPEVNQWDTDDGVHVSIRLRYPTLSVVLDPPRQPAQQAQADWAAPASDEMPF